MDKNILQSLARTLNLTDLEPEQEDFILTDQECDLAVSNAITEAKRHMEWKLAALHFSQMDILQKISEVDWIEEINKEDVLNLANSNKHYGIWQQAQRKAESEEVKQKEIKLKILYSAKNMFALMKWTSENKFGKPLIVNENNKKFISALCFFVSGDERFESQLGFYHNKGLLIRGVSGLGKTHLVRCLEDNELNPLLVLSMVEIADEVKQEGEYSLKLGNKKMIYLDDVGTEEATVNHYGTKINFFKNFIEMVYLRNKTFNKLIISTNNSFKEIEEKYGFRVRSRMKEMFNVIDVKGEDMRG